MDCAIFICYYFREVIDENGRHYKVFPIARYLCRRKGKKRGLAHKTFSLLPYQLVPYTKYSIPFIIKTVKLRHIEGLSLYELQDYLAGFGQKDILSISVGQLLGFKQVVMEAIQKIMSTGYYQEFEGDKYVGRELLISFIEFAEDFESKKIQPCIRGPCILSYDFYISGGEYFQNAYFLFGTPSQFR